jgi:hypothetical protein
LKNLTRRRKGRKGNKEASGYSFLSCAVFPPLREFLLRGRRRGMLAAFPALQREILHEEIRAAVGKCPKGQELQDFATRLLELAA